MVQPFAATIGPGGQVELRHRPFTAVTRVRFRPSPLPAVGISRTAVFFLKPLYRGARKRRGLPVYGGRRFSILSERPSHVKKTVAAWRCRRAGSFSSAAACSRRSFPRFPYRENRRLLPNGTASSASRHPVRNPSPSETATQSLRKRWRTVEDNWTAFANIWKEIMLLPAIGVEMSYKEIGAIGGTAKFPS